MTNDFRHLWSVLYQTTGCLICLRKGKEQQLGWRPKVFVLRRATKPCKNWFALVYSRSIYRDWKRDKNPKKSSMDLLKSSTVYRDWFRSQFVQLQLFASANLSRCQASIVSFLGWGRGSVKDFWWLLSSFPCYIVQERSWLPILDISFDFCEKRRNFFTVL